MVRRYHHGDLKNALIRAGAEILARQGVAALSLRSVAARAGVSHSAPYAHFADKQALIAAISTEGLRQLWSRVEAATARHAGDPLRQLEAAGWETLRFGLEDPDHYRVVFSDAIEREQDYPAWVELTQRSFGELVRLVEACQAAGVLAAGPADQLAVELWSLVHGLVSLLTSRQVPGRLAERLSPRALLAHALRSMVRGSLTLPAPPAARSPARRPAGSARAAPQRPRPARPRSPTRARPRRAQGRRPG